MVAGSAGLQHRQQLGCERDGIEPAPVATAPEDLVE
jgi:hypothetical protein